MILDLARGIGIGDHPLDIIDEPFDGLLYEPRVALGVLGPDEWLYGSGGPTRLMPGDADQDLDFDQLDLVQVQVAAKYLTGQSATWGEGDWNGAPAPNGVPGSPPAGDGVFDQLDIIAALNANVYLKGNYAGLTLAEARVFDDATLRTTSVPEPFSLTMLAIGCLGMFVVYVRWNR